MGVVDRFTPEQFNALSHEDRRVLAAECALEELRLGPFWCPDFDSEAAERAMKAQHEAAHALVLYRCRLAFIRAELDPVPRVLFGEKPRRRSQDRWDRNQLLCALAPAAGDLLLLDDNAPRRVTFYCQEDLVEAILIANDLARGVRRRELLRRTLGRARRMLDKHREEWAAAAAVLNATGTLEPGDVDRIVKQ